MSESFGDDYLLYAPHPPASTLTQWLDESNGITRQILSNVSIADQIVPQINILNPPLWELGHLTWFHEFWVHRNGQESKPSFMKNADYLFNSSEMAHQDRWSTPMPSLDSLLEYNHSVIEKTQDSLRTPIDNQAAYFIQLAILHQDMHNEAFAYMWQTMGRSMPFAPFTSMSQLEAKVRTWIHFPKSTIQAGSEQGSGFMFDNEKWAHSIDLPAFDIASTPVTNGDYLEFLQSPDNLAQSTPVAPPSHWKQEGDVWLERIFNQWQPLTHAAAVRHISYLDAQRFCEHHQVRLPNEHELSLLMLQKQGAWQSSNLWEWTSSTFAPFPGFSADPYVDYSQPWFDGNHQVLKGGSSFTPDRLKRVAFRNFYQAHRGDHFCGFRTCLL
ncbi:SUMF1/EgtB/PvdO family nonheme iron enzyme [Polynucleobacter bastaniensis]|uniref:SUMF1/EgtB/PvdO family nonheme iron enzyme n=1 Tax=Polynucleobacter bastaniensis TaxID=2081039 RepID=UPI001C0CFD17|nr:SUMF1/EgtB/PvdO family nonheme iron enzyme [Polynucleobacter bastaniensis]MBU3598449.1 ergothioneine biosynthesis protein EgtB [Polynucleobacter bastaniensis]